jgi:flagellar assembly protein FliH
MKWPDPITLNKPLRDVRVLTRAPAQDWQEHLREREQVAFENGRREGERSLGGQLLQQRNELVELQNGILNSLQQTLPRLIQENESALMNLALELAQKIVGGLPVDQTLVETVVREALQQAKDTSEMAVQLHPEDLALLRRHNSPLLNGLPETGPLRFTGSSGVARGGCIVQTRFGLIDAQHETKVEQLRKALLA